MATTVYEREIGGTGGSESRQTLKKRVKTHNTRAKTIAPATQAKGLFTWRWGTPLR